MLRYRAPVAAGSSVGGLRYSHNPTTPAAAIAPLKVPTKATKLNSLHAGCCCRIAAVNVSTDRISAVMSSGDRAGSGGLFIAAIRCSFADAADCLKVSSLLIRHPAFCQPDRGIALAQVAALHRLPVQSVTQSRQFFAFALEDGDQLHPGRLESLRVLPEAGAMSAPRDPRG